MVVAETRVVGESAGCLLLARLARLDGAEVLGLAGLGAEADRCSRIELVLEYGVPKIVIEIANDLRERELPIGVRFCSAFGKVARWPCWSRLAGILER